MMIIVVIIVVMIVIMIGGDDDDEDVIDSDSDVSYNVSDDDNSDVGVELILVMFSAMITYLFSYRSSSLHTSSDYYYNNLDLPSRHNLFQEIVNSNLFSEK